MDRLAMFEYGAGDLVVLCHGAASHSGQWRSLIEQLAPSYRIVAFDQYGYRNSPKWTKNRPLMIADQAEPILQYLNTQTGPIHLVGHSHGSTIATHLVGHLKDRISSLSIFEPNAFGALDTNHTEEQSMFDEIRRAFGDVEERMSTLESRTHFAKELLNFWLGAGAWQNLTEKLRTQLISMMKATAKDVYAALNSPIDLAPLQLIESRILFMFDPHTPRLAQVVSQQYLEVLPNCTVHTFPHCGHLAPIFHTERVNQVIIEHIQNMTNKNDR
jgi:pimeloyl-ACP methyl ester carboxylesterase